MKRFIGITVLAASVLSWLAGLAVAETRQAVLTGFQESPAVLTPASGTFRGDISGDETSIAFELSYQGLGGTVTAAHIHAGQPDVNGAVVIFLCGGAKPACPAPPATVSGTLTSADVLPVVAQGVPAGDLGAVIQFFRKRAAYVNVHSTPDHPGGEIRGNVR